MCLQAIRDNCSAEFETKTLKQGQDPPVYKWELVQILLKAHLTTEEGAKTTLLTRHFMKGQPKNIKIKLFESEPVTDIQNNLSFVQRYRAIQNYTTKQTGTVTTPGVWTWHPQDWVKRWNEQLGSYGVEPGSEANVLRGRADCGEE